MEQPTVIILAGPNGAGKTTASARLLRGQLEVSEYVNADVIAQGLSGFSPEGVAIEAGRILLTRTRELAAKRVSFAFETTLASRSFAPWVKQLVADGYKFVLIYLWVPNANLSVARVARRVASGGHHVPEDDVRRRYVRGLKNFFDLYRSIAETWYIYDSSQPGDPRLVAHGQRDVETVLDGETWRQIKESL